MVLTQKLLKIIKIIILHHRRIFIKIIKKAGKKI